MLSCCAPLCAFNLLFICIFVIRMTFVDDMRLLFAFCASNMEV